MVFTPAHKQCLKTYVNIKRGREKYKERFGNFAFLCVSFCTSLSHFCAAKYTISFPEPTCLLVSTKTWNSGIIHFQYYDDWLLNLSDCSCVNSLQMQVYFWLSLGFTEINYFRQDQVTAGNMSAFAG